MKRLNYVLNMSKHPGGHAYLMSYLKRGIWGREYNLTYIFRIQELIKNQ